MRARCAALVLCAVLCALLCACGESGPSRPSGVLLVSIDSLRADHLACYGYQSPTRPGNPTTPNIDILARSGVLFERAVSTTSWTLPAHMALLTGLPDEVHGVREMHQRLPASRPLLAELFQAQGWRTAGFWSGPNLHPWFGFGRGFERYVDCSRVEVARPEVFEQTSDEACAEVQAIHDRSHDAVTGPAVVAAFEDWFAGLAVDERFFAFVHLWDVHYDYAAPREHDIFFPGYDGPPTDGDLDRIELPATRTERQRLVTRLVSLYDAEIRFTDGNVARILGALQQAGRLDDTLVVLTSDHGEEFLEHTRFGHKRTLFEEVVRVPLLVRYPPRAPRGLRVGELVGLVDVAPTILDLAGLQKPKGMWGRSLAPALASQPLSRRPLPLELTVAREGIDLRAVHAGDHKVLRDSAAAAPLLFDLVADPREERPRAFGSEVDIRDRRLRFARALWRRVDELARSAEPAAEGVRPDELDERLRDAGYLGDDEPAGGDD